MFLVIVFQKSFVDDAQKTFLDDFFPFFLWMMRCSGETLRLSRVLMASFVTAGTFIVSA